MSSTDSRSRCTGSGGGARRTYGVWALTDETYAITSAGPGAGLTGPQITVLQLTSHVWWAGAAFAGALIGRAIPASVVGFGFALTAMFITLLVDSLRHHASKIQVVAASLAVAVAVLTEHLSPGYFLISGLAVYLAIVTARYLRTPAAARSELR